MAGAAHPGSSEGKAMTTINDCYRLFEEMHGSDKPAWSRDDLRDWLHGKGYTRYEDVDEDVLGRAVEAEREAEEAAGVECIYCWALGTTQAVPDVDDDDSWDELAKEHGDDCEWVLTRAHRREVAR
jgi:hypothetical protein